MITNLFPLLFATALIGLAGLSALWFRDYLRWRNPSYRHRRQKSLLFTLVFTNLTVLMALVFVQLIR